MSVDYDAMRIKMVDEQLERRGIRSRLVLDAMARVKREQFVTGGAKSYAYDDSPLTIGSEQTISQPYMVAYMIEAMELYGDETVLEIGTGSGYAAAVLAEIVDSVYSIERIESLAEWASENLTREGYQNVQVRCDDGSTGWPENGPFDAIVVAAAGPSVPTSLKEQLKIGGRLVIPVGTSLANQRLIRIVRKSETQYAEESMVAVRFVPLIGKEAWRTG